MCFPPDWSAVRSALGSGGQSSGSQWCAVPSLTASVIAWALALRGDVPLPLPLPPLEWLASLVSGAQALLAWRMLRWA